MRGDHDFSRGTIAGGRAEVGRPGREVESLHGMPEVGGVPLAGNACPVGPDGRGDGRPGDYYRSHVRLNNFALIGAFGRSHEDPEARLAKRDALGDEAADHLRGVLPGTLEWFRRVIILTHSGNGSSTSLNNSPS